MARGFRVAIVSPRFGETIGGGAETLAREYAARLAERMDVTVLTTCATEYRTWRDAFAAGERVENGLRVLRFSVPESRDPRAFDRISAHVLTGMPHDESDEEAWMDAQGPNAPGLLEHLDRFGTTYDAVVFVPYLYATTVRGLPLVADRAVLVGAFHDEPPLRLSIFAPVVEAAQSYVLSTPEEQALALSRFSIHPSRCHIVGAGVEMPDSETSPERSRETRQPYVICVGRIDPSKGSDTLLQYHRTYRSARPAGLDLVMVGPSVMALPNQPWLSAPGYVSEVEKYALIRDAQVLICPSPFESLSLVLLEAWANGIPTVCSAASAVLVGQSRRSGGGLWYRDAAEYVECLNLLTDSPALRHALGRSGWRFARSLTWSRVIDRLEDALRQAAGLEAPVSPGEG